MKRPISIIINNIILIILLQSAHGQDTAPNAAQDKSISADSSQALRVEASILPYIESARKTYPEAKARYLEGLPEGSVFYITTRLYDLHGRFELVFIRVRNIAEGQITGMISNRISTVKGYQEGDIYTFPEKDLVDWTILNPDGGEEGNAVGKFLDTIKL